ncbi:DNA primase [Vogesella indigofera]|uniref:DNA primase n=1 Tax=Vogesella indigofera TaxID=45465 RepID=UPI00234F4B0C|nr:DNA primase [Vogesella indigofera]MDC7706175.1 DNA primase [Vogesella indigofera]
MIPQDFIDQLLSRVDIVDVVDRYVPLKKAGQNYMACCPFHKEKSPSFTVSPSKQFYHCFGCGAHGSAIGFVMEYQGLPFVDAVKTLAEGIGLPVPEERTANPEASRAAREKKLSLEDALEQAARYYKQQLKQAPVAIDYLKGRGLTGEVAARFALGYAPDNRQNLASVFPEYLSPVLAECGLVIDAEDGGRRYDRFRERVMFPIRNQRGGIIGFGGRILSKDKAPNAPKYLNSPETPLFEKGRELYGLYEARQAIRDANAVLVVEGYMDVVALAQYGVAYAVATLGTATTGEHVRKLLRHADHVYFCFDGDKAGQKAAWRALENSLPQLVDGKALHFLFLPQEHDPDSYIREFGREAFEAALKEQSVPLSAYFTQELTSRVDMSTPEGRADLVRQAKPLLEQIAAPTLGYIIKKRLAELAGMDVDEFDMLTGHSRPERKGRRDYQLPEQSNRPGSSSMVRKQIKWLLMNPAWAHDVLVSDNRPYENEMATLVAIVEAIQASDSELTTARLAEFFRHSPHELTIDSVLLDTMREPEEFSNPDQNDRENFRLGFIRLTDRYDDDLISSLSAKGYEHLSSEELQLLRTLLARKLAPSGAAPRNG